DMLYLPALLLLKSEIAKDLIKAQWNYVIVDEYQDTSNLEFFVIKCLINDKNNLMVVGDPNQSIYEWRGADIGNILNFRDFAPNVTEVRLSQNYRSSNEILEFSNSIIQNSDANIFKNSLRGTFSSNKPTIVKCGSDISEARYIRNHISNNMTKFDSMAVLYRTNSQSRIIESTLMESGIRYKILGGLSIFQREEIKTMISYLKSWNEEYCDIISLERAISCPRIGIGDVKIQEIFMCCEKFNMGPIECLRNSVLEDNDSEIRKIKLSKKQKLCVSNFLSILDDIKDAYNKNGLYGAFVIIADKTGLKEFYRAKEKGVDKVNNINNLKDLYRFSSISLGDFLDKLYVMGGEERDDTKASVVLSTIHSAKGLEFDSVIVCGVEDGIMPHYSALSIDEELRLLYVALTRAKYELIMTCAHSRMVHGIVQRNSVSRFLKKVSLSMYNRENLYESKY
ncbi:MAG: UvrD-helicase domain-containing protein, partial [Chlamydiia bacterium]|nr:UvrD-helicase domain-containing protein [Chlamydiia bacterium]